MGEVCRLLGHGPTCDQLGLGEDACGGDLVTYTRADLVHESRSLMLNETKVVASDGQPHDSFGYFGVALSEGDLLVGANGADDAGHAAGAAYVFRSDGNGEHRESKLMASDASAGDRFGYAGVAMDGDVLVVAAPFAGSGAGAVYRYEPDGSGGYDEVKLVASDAAAGDLFGAGVAASGGSILVAAPGNDEAGEDAGAAYLFRPNDTGGFQEHKIMASDAQPGELFGFMSVAMDDDELLIAAPLDDEAGDDAGAVYLYRPDGTGAYSETKIMAGDAAAGDLFGYFGVAIDDGDLLVGSLANDEAGVDAGAAYLYRADGAGGHVETKLLASDAGSEDIFGAGVALSGEDVLVGAMRNDEAGCDAGAAYWFRSDGEGGHVETKIVASDALDGDQFGAGVDLEHGMALIASPSHREAGAAYRYELVSCIGCPS